MYLIIDTGIELDCYLAGRWDDYVARLVEVPVWIERVAL